MSKIRASFALLLVVGLLLAACSGPAGPDQGATQPTAAAPAPAAEQPTAVPAEPVAPASDSELPVSVPRDQVLVVDQIFRYSVADNFNFFVPGPASPTQQGLLYDTLYTQILKRSVPEPDPRLKWTDKVALARPEAEEYLQAGCKFAGRCPFVMDVCRRVVPKDVVAEGRSVKCHLYDPAIPKVGD